MTAWKKTAEEPMPADRPVLVRSTTCPLGWVAPPYTLGFAHRGRGSTPGLFVGSQFYPDRPPKGDPAESAVWTEWTEIPA